MVESGDLTVAIISYNSFNTIEACLSELIDSNRFPVTIVDNASTDGSADKLKKRYPNANILESDINLGYGRAANLAIKECGTRYFFLVNPDLKAAPDAVEQLLTTCRKLDDSTALVAPSVQKETHTNSGLQQQPWVIGAAMLFNLHAMKPIGYFDENIFLFSEETDLCKRIINAGLKIYLDSDIYIEHLYRQSSTPSKATEALKDWHQGWSRMYYRHKYGEDHGKQNPYRVTGLYWLKYRLATNPEKKQRYKYRYLGSLAFLKGKPAIAPNGAPFVPSL